MARTYSLDLETTGLDADRDAIIEVGAVKFRGDEVLGTYTTFVNPGRRIPLEITELTGIRDDDVAGAPGLHDVLSRPCTTCCPAWRALSAQAPSWATASGST